MFLKKKKKFGFDNLSPERKTVSLRIWIGLIYRFYSYLDLYDPNDSYKLVSVVVNFGCLETIYSFYYYYYYLFL